MGDVGLILKGKITTGDFYHKSGISLGYTTLG
jgi:hypothetical protein